MDDNGHGTHAAGILGGNNETYKGVVPDANIIALKVLNASGSGSFGDVELALQWVIANHETYNIVSINMSLGAGNYTNNPYTFLEDEFATLKDLGIFIAVAAGNSYYSYGSVQGMGYPAVSPNVVSVVASWDANVGSVNWADGAKDYSTDVDRITSFSQRSSASSIMAPGALITAAYPGNSYSTLAGTSMAAPIVAGTAVMLRQALEERNRHDLANQDSILSFMQDSGVTIVDGDYGYSNVQHSGLSFVRLDIAEAMNDVDEQAQPSASATPSPRESPSPSASASPSEEPSSSPSESPSPSEEPTPSSTATPAVSPSPTATDSPIPEPSNSPEATPTPNPTAVPTPTTPDQIADFMDELKKLLENLRDGLAQDPTNFVDTLKEFQSALKESLRKITGVKPRILRKMKTVRRDISRLTRLTKQVASGKAGPGKIRKQQRLSDKLAGATAALSSLGS
ncbi:MAG: S8 family serine peptidase [Bdellovibrionales bacterium]|nr:S8 family serine peptidase [Bdellovibrionales bacterium]